MPFSHWKLPEHYHSNSQTWKKKTSNIMQIISKSYNVQFHNAWDIDLQSPLNLILQFLIEHTHTRVRMSCVCSRLVCVWLLTTGRYEIKSSDNKMDNYLVKHTSQHHCLHSMFLNVTDSKICFTTICITKVLFHSSAKIYSHFPVV
jgi:hypothetical protein